MEVTKWLKPSGKGHHRRFQVAGDVGGQLINGLDRRRGWGVMFIGDLCPPVEPLALLQSPSAPVIIIAGAMRSEKGSSAGGGLEKAVSVRLPTSMLEKSGCGFSGLE